MRTAAAFILGAAAALVAYFWATTGDHPQPPRMAPAAGDAPAAPEPAAAAASAAARTAPELDSMSLSFRNTTFLIGIRDAGFACEDVVDAHRTGPEVWTATCRDLRGYAISVEESGELAVVPVPHYFDNVGPVIPERDDSLRLEPDIDRFRRQPLPPR